MEVKMRKVFLIFYPLLVCGGVLMLLFPQYQYPLIHLYLGLIMGLLIWFNTKKSKYIIIYSSLIVPSIILTAIISRQWSNINHIAIILILSLSAYWLLNWLSKSIRYKCSKCGYLISVSVLKFLTSLHAFDTRRLKCPSCTHTDWFKAEKNTDN